MVIFYNILDISAANAFVIWMHLNPTWNKQKTHRRRLFLKELGKCLVANQLLSRLLLPNLSLNLRDSICNSLANISSRNVELSSSMSFNDPQNNTKRSNDENKAKDNNYFGVKRKRGRCKLCVRSLDKKVRTTCDKCNNFVCCTHSKILCNVNHTCITIMFLIK